MCGWEEFRDTTGAGCHRHSARLYSRQYDNETRFASPLCSFQHVRRVAGHGVLNPKVKVKIIGHAGAPPSTRNLFNSLTEVIVQSTRVTGKFKLTANAEGRMTATVVVRARPCTPRPSVP
jgi:hypothetical protein